MLITTAADDFDILILYFSEKKRLKLQVFESEISNQSVNLRIGISCESSARQTIHRKYQFSDLRIDISCESSARQPSD